MSVHFIVKNPSGGGGGGGGTTIVQGVQTSGAGPGGSSSQYEAFAAPVTAGNTLIATIGWDSSAANSITSVSDNLNGNWTAAGALEQGNSCSAAIYYFHNTLGGTCTVTVHIATSMPYLEISVIEVSGLAGVIDAYTANTHGSPDTTATPGNLVATGPNDFLIAFCVPGTNVNGGTTGWSFTNFSDSGNGYETLIAASAGTYSPTFTMDGYNYASVAAAFK